MLIPIVTFAAVTIGSLTVGVAVLRRRAWNVLDPTVVFWFGYAVFYGVANLWFVREVSRDGVFDRGGFWFDAASRSDFYYLNTVAALTAVYGLAVAIGIFGLGPLLLRAGIGHLARKVGGGPDLTLGLLVPMCVLSWLMNLGVIPSAVGGLPSGVLGIPLVCCLALNCKLSCQAAQRLTARTVLLAIGVLAVSAVCGAATGMKQSLLMPVLAAFAGLVLAVRRPWPIAVAILVALPAFVALQTFNKLSRAVIWDSTTNLSVVERIEAIGSAAVSVAAPDQSEAERTDINRLCTAVPMMQTLALLQRGDGISVLDGLVVPYVPRALWPSKPQVVVGNTLYRKFSGDEQGGSSSSPGQPAEAFMYGGWMGVVALGLGMGLLAALAGSIVQHLWAARKAASLGVVILMALNFGKCENWFWTYVPSVLNCVVSLVALQLATRCLSRLKPLDHTAITIAK